MIQQFLKRVSLFQNLSEDDIDRLCGLLQEIDLRAGEELFAEGSPGDRAYIIRDGELEIVKQASGREVLLSVRGAGEVIGEMSLLEKAPRSATIRARTDSKLIVLSQSQFERLLSTSPTAARTMLDIVLTRWRATEALLRQSEKMAQLGTLTAGIAHELNNPAAAVRRGATQLQETLAQLESARAALGRLVLDEAQQQLLQDMVRQAEDSAHRPPQLDALARSDRESALETWLEARGVANAWELAPTLVDLDFDEGKLAALAGHFSPADLEIVIGWLGAVHTATCLLSEIGQGASRISEIVRALKTYAYLDQAPVQNVDVHEGLENTLIILRNKLKAGVTIRREYAPDLPKIEAYGSELNQVWTNLIDNAIDALDGHGEIVLRTRQEDDLVVVEIEDNGPGIPEEILPRIFEPFFTTKPVGQGTGLGLDISYNIVVLKQRGDIKVQSQPGKTSFRVELPVRLEAK